MGRRSARVEEGAFVVEGPGLIAQAAASGWDLEAVFVSAGEWSYTPPEGVAVFELAPKVMERVASTDAPQAAIAVARRRCAPISSLDAATFVLVGDRISDPGNAGTMLRSAEAAGADAVVFTEGSVDVFNPKVVRSSAGALFHVPVITDVTLEAVLALSHLRSFGATSHVAAQSQPHTASDFGVPIAIVVGNEAHGLAPDTAVDAWVTIPHAGRAESLNVAMAATVLVFEVVRQRTAG